MNERPTIDTPRLTLRPFRLTDAPEVQRLASDRDIASTTQKIPYPYEDGMAEEWIGTHQARYERGEGVTFAIVRRADNALMRAVGLGIDQQHRHALLGAWVGKRYWNQGYCTEADAAVVRYGFERLGLNRMYAAHFTRNPASGRVLQKIGMVHEGCQRQHIQKWGVFEDLELFGMLKSDYELQKRSMGKGLDSTRSA